MVNSMLIRERKEEREGGWGEWEVRRVGGEESGGLGRGRDEGWGDGEREG